MMKNQKVNSDVAYPPPGFYLAPRAIRRIVAKRHNELLRQTIEKGMGR